MQHETTRKAVVLGRVLQSFLGALMVLQTSDNDRALRFARESRKTVGDLLRTLGVNVTLPNPRNMEEIAILFQSQSVTSLTKEIHGRLNALHSAKVGNAFFVSTLIAAYAIHMQSGDPPVRWATVRRDIERLAKDLHIQPEIVHEFLNSPSDKNEDRLLTELLHESVKTATKILFLASNPRSTDRLNLDQEIRSIDQVLLQAEFRDKFDLEKHVAVRVTDIQSLLLRHKPDIVHFSGHGSPSSEIILEDEFGNSHPVSVRALSQLFLVLRDNIKCVVLNACYSEQQAQAIAKHVDSVIGMSKAVGDAAAIAFAMAFYQALGYGCDLRTAFEAGCNQIDLQNLDEPDIPKLIALRANPKDIVFVHNP